MRSLTRSSVVASFGSVVSLGLAMTACAGPSVEGTSPSEDAITSNDGTPLELRFSGEVTAAATDTPRRAIASQLQYMQGILTSAVKANGQTGMPALKNIVETVSGDTKKITYEALPAPSRHRLRRARQHVPAVNLELDQLPGSAAELERHHDGGADGVGHRADPHAREA